MVPVVSSTVHIIYFYLFIIDFMYLRYVRIYFMHSFFGDVLHYIFSNIPVLWCTVSGIPYLNKIYEQILRSFEVILE